MSETSWEKFGKQISKTVQDAVENQNYEKLNQAVSDTLNQAVKSVAEGIKNAAEPTGKYHGYKTYTTQSRQEKKQGPGMHYTNVSSEEKAETLTFPIKAPSTMGAVLPMVLGYWFGTMQLLIVLAAGIFGIMSVPMAILGFWIGFRGRVKLGRVRRFRKYIDQIDKREYCNISELAAKAGVSADVVIKDLEYMIKKQWFRQGHFDRQKTCLIVTDGMYRQYCQLEEEKEIQYENYRNKKDEKEKSRDELPPEIQKINELGEEYICKLRRCNDAIPGEQISEKISRIEILTERIFDRVRQNPASIEEIQKLMDYYLPTTVKLLEAYAQMDAQPVSGENIQTAKKEIEDTLDTLNTAFAKLLDSLFQETAWDVSSDIYVLNTLLAQQGLKEKDL